MADDDLDTKKPSQDTTLTQNIRRSINDAYAAVKGQEAVNSFSALTFEELVEQQLVRYEGETSGPKPNEITRIQGVKESLLASVAQIEKIKKALLKPDAERDTNT
jgi:hypothetical protein